MSTGFAGLSKPVKGLPQPVRLVVRRVLNRMPRYDPQTREEAVAELRDLIRKPFDVWRLYQLGIECHGRVVESHLDAGMAVTDTPAGKRMKLVVLLRLKVVGVDESHLSSAEKLAVDLWKRGFPVRVWAPSLTLAHAQYNDRHGQVIVSSDDNFEPHFLFDNAVLGFDTQGLTYKGSPHRYIHGLTRKWLNEKIRPTR